MAGSLRQTGGAPIHLSSARLFAENHIVPRLGEMELTSVTEPKVRSFLKDCHDHGDLRRNEPLSQETMRHICVLLSGILNQAVGDGHIEKNPAEDFRYNTSKKVQAEALTGAKIEEYLDAAAELGSAKLETVQGKKSYGYLPKSVKRLVDGVVDEMERLPIVRECYERWLELQGKVQSYYIEGEIKPFRLSQQKEFRQIKNAVIQEALKLGVLTFKDGDICKYDEPDPEENVTWAYWDLKEIIRDRHAELSQKDAAVTEMLKLAENGDVHAQYFMGKLYRDGDPVLPNSQAAEYWLEAAAKQGLDIA